MNFDFEKSVEFDLFACDYGRSLMENYQMLDLLYESDRSAVYKLLRFSDQKHYTLKALKKEEGIVYDLARIAHLSANVKRVPSMVKYIYFNTYKGFFSLN